MNGSDNQAVTRFCRALLDLTVRENTEAMNAITGFFTEVAGCVEGIEQSLSQLSGSPEAREKACEEISAQSKQAAALVKTGIMAMQSHDITDQRLEHLARLLLCVEQGIDGSIEEVLTEYEERTLLEMLTEGVSVEVALERLENGGNGPMSSVELF